MSRYRTELGPVIYNPATRAYEALVSFCENGEVERYPCALRFPIDTDSGTVALALIRQAREMRRSARVPLRSRLSARDVARAGSALTVGIRSADRPAA